MTDLPLCRWRGEATVPSHHKCSSSKLSHSSNGVADALCEGCSVRDHEPETEAQLAEKHRIQQEIRAIMLRRSANVSSGLTEDQAQSFIGWIGNYAALGAQLVQEYKRWWLAGCPRPTAEELTERLNACNACPHVRKPDSKPRSACGVDQPTCGLCGCPLNGTPILFGFGHRPGKAEMSTTTCPDNPPRWKSLV